MKTAIAFLTLCTTLLVVILSTFDLSITHFDNGLLIFIYFIIIGIIFLIITSVINIINIFKNDIKLSLIKDNDFNTEQIITCIRNNKDYIKLHNETIGNNIIHTIITDSKLHHDKLIILLNNNLIETHTTHELLKELFMLENDTNRLLHFDVDNNQQDLFCKQVIEDSINDTKIKDIIIEDDKVIIPKEKNSRTINRRKKQQL